MAANLAGAVVDPLRNAVPFLVITALWIVVMLVLYGLFLATKPAGLSYGPLVHTSVFVPPLVGFAGHVLQQVRTDTTAP